MNRTVQPKPRKDSSTRQTNWNAWILFCTLAILIIVIVLIEMHIRQLTIHSTLLGYQEGLWRVAVDEAPCLDF